MIKNYEKEDSTICSKLTIKTPERRKWRRSDVFIVNSEHISHYQGFVQLCNFAFIFTFGHVFSPGLLTKNQEFNTNIVFPLIRPRRLFDFQALMCSACKRWRLKEGGA